MKYCFYALRLCGTQKYMPNTYAGSNPSTLEPAEVQPRLFQTSFGAAKALTQWRKGAHLRHEVGGDYESEIKPRPERAGLKFEIVVFELKEVGSIKI